MKSSVEAVSQAIDTKEIDVKNAKTFFSVPVVSVFHTNVNCLI